MVDAELVRSRTAKDNAMHHYVKARDSGVRDQRLLTLARQADATAKTALDVEILELKVKLAYLTAEVKSAAFGQIESLFRAKYGPPSISREEPWQSKGGVRTESHVRAWGWNGLSIHLKSPSDDVDHAWLVVATPEVFESLEKEQSERFKRGVGDL